MEEINQFDKNDQPHGYWEFRGIFSIGDDDNETVIFGKYDHGVLTGEWITKKDDLIVRKSYYIC